MSASPYVAVCGKCNVPISLHPYESCPYEYRPIMYGARLHGYELVRKKENGKNKKNKEEGVTA